MPDVSVNLTLPEFEKVGHWCVNHRVHCVKTGAKARYGEDENPWECQALGLYGEFAVSKYLGLPFDETPGRDDADVGPFGVRTTRAYGRLLLHTEENLQKKFVLVHRVGDLVYRIKGWAWGWKYEKRPLVKLDRKGKKKPCIVVELSELESMRDIWKGLESPALPF